MSAEEFDRREVQPFETFSGWVEWCETYLGRIGRRAGRKLADFPALLLATNALGLVVVMDCSAWVESERKDELGHEVMPTFIRSVEATRFAWASSSWMSPVHGTPERAEFDAWYADHESMEGGPHVREMAQVVFGDWTGDQAHRGATIFRPRSGPDRWKLGPWSSLFGDADTVNWLGDSALTGRLVDDSMRAVMGSPTEREYKGAALRVSQAAPAREAILTAMVEVVGEMGADDVRALSDAWRAEEDGDIVESFMRRVGERLSLDPGSSRVLRDLLAAELGPLSPIGGGL